MGAKLTTIVISLTLILFFCASFGLADKRIEFIDGCVEYSWVGMSPNGFTGRLGLEGTVDCQQIFPGSRMCTSEEILRTIDVPAADERGAAWVKPTFVPGSDSGGAGAVDMSGRQDTPKNLSCGGGIIGSNGTTGLIIYTSSGTPRGAFGLATCDTKIPVACCAPVQ